MRLTVCLEGNTEGRVLASVDMEEIVKMTITDDVEKSNFNPQMLKSCTDTSYQCGYEQGRADAIDECIELVDKIMPPQPYLLKTKHYENWKMKTTELRMLRNMMEQLKEQK